MKFNWTVLWEATKEPLRLLVLSAIPVLLAYFGTIDAQWAAFLILVLRFTDKYLYELGKATNNTKLEGGLTRF